MNDKLYIKKFIRDDGQKLSFDGEQLYLAQENTLLVRPDPNTTAVSFTEADGGEMIRQQNNTYDQPVNGLIIPKTTDYWTLTTQLSLFFKINHTYKIIYTKKDGTMFAMSNAWISAGLQIVPVPHEEYSSWSITMTVGNVNWTEYAEDSQGNEIYSNNVTLPLLSAATGGEVWEDESSTPVSKEGSSITFDDTVSGASITSLHLKGDTYQQTYSGKNLFNKNGTYITAGGTGESVSVIDTGIKVTYGTNGGSVAARFMIGEASSLVGKTITLSADVSKSASGLAPGMYIGVSNADLSSVQRMSDYVSGTGSKSVSWTVTEDNTKPYIMVALYVTNGGSPSQGDYSSYENAQLELGSSPTSYEPYTGGIASPNPDYPQQIDVVTGAQTVTISDSNNQSQSYEVNLGKNLFDKNNLSDGWIDSTGSTNTDNSWKRTDYVPIKPNTNYTTSGFANGSGANPARCYYDSSKVFISGVKHNGANPFSNTSPDNAYYMIECCKTSDIDTVQLEVGSTATPYAPYFTPIELCKIGTYQDYIYKSEGDWYVHKDCGKVILTGDESETWNAETSGGYRRFRTPCTDLPDDSNRHELVSDHFYYLSSGAGACFGYAQRIYLYYGDSSTTTTTFRTWLSSNNTTVYYALATPTDTKITDNTLIGELEGLYAAQGYDDKTIITVTATGTNLPTILAISLQNPPITGEKWDSVGTVWELGSGGTQSINVASTTVVYPVWVVEGPCVNPVLQNNTTDTIAQYDGTVATGQTLTVDFANGTAYLDSALVTRNVTGLVSMQPGENIVGFNSDGGDTDSSKIYWNNTIN